MLFIAITDIHVLMLNQHLTDLSGVFTHNWAFAESLSQGWDEQIQINLFLDQSLEGSKDLHVPVHDVNQCVCPHWQNLVSIQSKNFKKAYLVKNNPLEKKKKKKKDKIYFCMVYFQRPLSLKYRVIFVSHIFRIWI